MAERWPSAEASESYFVDLIRSQPENPETWSRFRDWCKQELSRDLTPRGRIEHNIRIAGIYRAAGQLGQAWDELEGVRRQALQEGLQDLYDAAMAIMDDIEETGR